MAKRSGRRSAAQTPAPKAEQIKGSKKNPKGSASSESSAAKIKLSEKTIDVLKNKLKDFKEKYPSKKNVSLGDLKAVYRRGSGAYSKSHRPTITGGKPNSRAAWSFARVNKFLEKAAGKPVKKAYVQDDDLLENGGTIKQDSLLKAVLPEVKRIFNANGLIINDDYSFTDGSNKSYLPYLGYMREGDKIKKVAITYYEQGFEVLGEVVIEVEDDKIEIEVEFPNWDIDEEVEFADGGTILEELENSLILAPNGNISNLTPEQYKLVRTPEFKAWFGDWENDPENASKVVDENGEPMVVYHGSRSNFSIFDIGKSGESSTPAKVGFWFTPIKKFAYNFAQTIWYGTSDDIIVYPLFLSIKNPKIYNSEIDSDVRYPDAYQKFKIDIWAMDGQDADRANVGGIGMALNNQKETIKKYRESLENQGFDGIFIKNTRFDRDDAGGLNDQIVALFPNQIKLADGTNKTFDPNDPDIRFAYGGRVFSSKLMMPKVRGGWTKEKILKYLKSYSSDTVGTFTLTKYISEFDNWEQLKDHIYYHGTTNYIEKGLKPSITFSERFAERQGGGGYGMRYWGISLTKRKRTAENFSGMESYVTIYPVILKRDAKVIERTDISDSSEIEDIIVDLYDKGIDAVWIGGGEEELVVINPSCILLYKKGSESHQVYGGLKTKQLTDDEIKTIYQQAKENWDKYSEEYNAAKTKEEREEIMKKIPAIKFEDGGEIVQCVRCDWTWSTADSDPSDMYVCHKCGFDNSLFYDGGILKPNLSIQEIAEKHNVELEYVIDQIFEGTQHELEHTESTDVAKKIALHHIAETPDYYQKLKTLNLEDGGRIERKIKERLSENFELPFELAVYVPSTAKADSVISQSEYSNRIDEVRAYLANLFGGYSSEGIDGGYVSDEKGLIREDVTKVTAFAPKENFEEKLQKLVNKIKNWCYEWGQESMGFEFEGDLYYISKNGKFMDGGDIEEDLFENYESLPAEVQEVLNKYSLEDETYENMENLLAELKPLGYTFEYGLDATPFGLKKMENGAIVEEVPEVEIEAYLMQQRAEAQDVITCTDSRIFKTMICKTKIEIAEKRMSETDNPEELNVWNECIVIWSDCLNDIVENNIPVREYKDGGKPCGCGQLYAKGGLAYGNSHDKGGIPLKVSSTGQNIEIEGGEGVVNKRSMQMTKKLEFEGKELTPCEVVSKINEMGGGVKFKCADVQEIIAEDGHF